MFQKFRIFIIRWTIAQFEIYLFERKVSSFYKKIFKRRDLTIIDVGANRGQTIDFFLKLNNKSRLYSFEPNPKLFEELQYKYSNYENIKGISNKIETKTFFENILDESSTFEELNMNSDYLKMKSSILGVNPKDIVKESYPVKVTTLNDFIVKNEIGKIDVLKIDTEGHEFECLEGLFKLENIYDVKIIQFEMHFDDMYLKNRSYEQMNNLLNRNDFFELKKIKHGFGDFYDYFYSNKNFLDNSL